MWQLLALALLPATNAEITVDGVAYGPRQTLTCTWFTNFENSKFDACRTQGRNVLRGDEQASINCTRDICAKMDAEARQVSHGQTAEPPSGTYLVRLVGRVSLSTHPKRYIGDGTRTVLIEKLLSVRTIK
jgi:hypothetical protein